jgi:peptidoglycan/LPS O-acetylase OafA/YrhL
MAFRFANQTGRFLGLDVLRFLLAFAVVIYHYYFFGPLDRDMPYQPLPAFHPTSYLFAAVEAFFVISGFVITMSAEKYGTLDFIAARFIRLFPALLVCSTITFACVTMIPAPDTPRADFGNFIASVLVLPLAVHQGLDWSFWSLKYELRFYSLVAFIILLNAQRNVVWIAAALILFDVTCFAAGRERPVFQLYLPFFAIGMLLYAVVVQRQAGWLVLVSFALGLLDASDCVTQEYNGIQEMFHFAVMGRIAGAAIVAVAFALVAFFVCWVPPVRFGALAKTLGAISYPLYLQHQLLGYWICNLVRSRFASWDIDLRPAVMAAMLVLSYLIATYAEPFISRIARRADAALRETRVRLG